MAYQETTRQSYGSKVKGSFQGILWGLILIIAGTVILWWNEGRAVKASDALKDFQKNYVELSDITVVDPAFEGKAVHATGVAQTADTLRDAAFGIAVNAMRLEREVEYYQWTEESSSTSKDKLGGATETTTTYTYEADWCSSPVNSNEFKDPDYRGKNFVWRMVDEVEQIASNVTFGAYRLTDPIVRRISGEQPAYPAMDTLMKAALLAQVSDSTVVVTVMNDQVYIGPDPAMPHIGDVRITFTQVTSPKTISLLEKVVNGTFENYVAKNGKAFSRVEMGTVSAENMFANQKSANKVLLWLLRILGIILVVGGFRNLLNFISTVFAVVPIVQKIIGTGIGLMTTIVGIVWSIVVIALAWVAHRPVLAISLLVIAAALIVWLVSRSRKKKISDVAAILVIGLMLCIGCTGNTDGGGDDRVASATRVKGPVQTVKVIEFYGEGEPVPTLYEYDENGKVISEKEINWEDEMDYGVIEALSVKDDKGNYLKEVWGHGDTPLSTQVYTYNEAGHVLTSESYDAEGTLNYSTRNTYDAAGHLVKAVMSTASGENATEYEYDAAGNAFRTTNSYNGEVNNINTYVYDEAGRVIMSNEYMPKYGRAFTNFTSYAADGDISGTIASVTDENGTRITNRDTTFTDKDGKLHQRIYSNYEYSQERTNEGIYNRQHYLTHYEHFEGTATRPSVIVDFKYDKDGRTLREISWKKLVLGEVKENFVKTYSDKVDTFGNWTRRTEGLSYLVDTDFMTFDNLEDFLPVIHREITYRGDDQGHNYGFTGTAGQAGIKLTYTDDSDILFGSLSIDGISYRAVGTLEKDGEIHVVALQENGNIPWSLTIPAGSDKREASLFQGANEIKATLSPTRDGLLTYKFGTVPDEMVGIYQFSYPDELGNGTMDVSRCGENWENVSIHTCRIGPAPLRLMAQDELVEFLGEDPYIYRFLWNDTTEESYEYAIRFFDGFAVVMTLKGNPVSFFGQDITLDGIYAKLPSVG